MKARLVAIAALLTAAGAGSIFFVNWDTAQVEKLPISFGAFEVFDKSQCTTSACGTAACDIARDHLTDSGFGSCTLRFIECPVRLGQRARNLGLDAGVTFGPGKYQQVRLTAMRCGTALGIAVDNNGWPTYAVATGTPGCKRRDAGVPVAQCQRVDGGNQGDENQYPASELTGAGCTPVPCGVIFGDPE